MRKGTAKIHLAQNARWRRVGYSTGKARKCKTIRMRHMGRWMREGGIRKA
jgi:hypothetical protein